MAVATNLSFTKTSEELYVSQPAISKQIALLEKELGVKLFKRDNKKTELTEAGKLYFKLFRDYKSEFMKTQREAAYLSSVNDRVIKLGFVEGWDLKQYLPRILDLFKEEFPDTKVLINCIGIKELSTLLLTGGIDIAITMKNSVVDIPEISLVDLCKIRKNIIYPRDSIFGETEDLNPIDFKEEVFFAPWGVVDKLVRESVHTYLIKYRFTPRLQFVSNHESMITCVRSRMGVAITDEWCWAKDTPELTYIDIDAYDDISIAYMNSKSDYCLSRLIEIVKETYTS